MTDQGERGRLRKATLDESNPLSYIPDGRSAQRDYYKLENRERQLRAVDNLTQAEKDFVMGGIPDAEREAGDANGGAAANTIKKALTRIHEKDLIEIRALVYLQRLPDTSPELNQLRIMTGLHNREQIAEFIAEKQIKKLMMSQLEAITGGTALTTVYKDTIKRGPQSFLNLWQ
jgi:hypothetical protein